MLAFPTNFPHSPRTVSRSKPRPLSIVSICPTDNPIPTIEASVSAMFSTTDRSVRASSRLRSWASPASIASLGKERGPVWGQPRDGRGNSRRRGRETSQKRHRAQGNRARARSVRRCGDLRSTPPPLGGRRFIRALPQRRATRKRGGFDTRAPDAPRRVSGVRGWGAARLARLARSWRGGEDRARGRRACHGWAWRATGALVSCWGAKEFFTATMLTTR